MLEAAMKMPLPQILRTVNPAEHRYSLAPASARRDPVDPLDPAAVL
jgi:hypothetical protein